MFASKTISLGGRYGETMNFWGWILGVPTEEDDWKSADLLKKELIAARKEIDILHKEVCHWKAIALNFRKFHQ